MMWDCTAEQMEARWAFGPYSARSIRWKVGHSVVDRKREEKEFSWWLRQKYPPETLTEINNPVSSSCVYVHGCWISKQINKVSHILFERFLISNQKWKFPNPKSDLLQKLVHSVLHDCGIISRTAEQMEYLRLINLISSFSEELLINDVFTDWQFTLMFHNCVWFILINTSESNVLCFYSLLWVLLALTNKQEACKLMQHRNICSHAAEFSHRTLQAGYTPTHTSKSPLRYLEQSTVGSKSGQRALHPGWAVRLTMPCSVLSRLGSP